jgi:putative DNA primase/helicase
MQAELKVVYETVEDESGQDSQRRGGGAPLLLLPPPSQPMPVARAFVAKHCTHESGALILRYWRDSWWAWRQSHWVEIDRRHVRSLLYTFTEHAMYIDATGPHRWSPTRYRIANLQEALGAVCFLDDKTDQPSWLDGRAGKNTIVALENGLLDVERRQLLPHTPLFFNQTAVPFPYDVSAPQPTEWLRFHDELWPQEPEVALVLAEWFGYVVSGRTDLHKILLMVGPTRGGKGLIPRLLQALIGPKNCAGPTLSSLSGDFGLAPLIGKSLAIVSEARLSSRAGNNVVVERLLAISGEDTITVNRKYRDQWTGKLPSRFHIISNELPSFGDASAAVIGRFVAILLSRSWLGKEDHTLETKLLAELPGILNWSLDGLHRLTIENKNRFTRLPAADDAMVAMRDLASPVAAFVREQCVLGTNERVSVETIYQRYKGWANDNGHRSVSSQMFGRNLRAACPGIQSSQPRGSDGKQYRAYSGISLKPDDSEQPAQGAFDGFVPP